MSESLERGLALIDDLGSSGELDSYHLFHAARADLLRRLGRNREARESYHRGLAITTNAVELRYLRRRISELDAPCSKLQFLPQPGNQELAAP